MSILPPMARSQPIPLASDHGVKLGVERRGSRNKTVLLGIACLALVWYSSLGVGLAEGSTETSLKVTPQTIEMGTFYNGEKVRIEGIADPGSEVLVVVKGANKDEFFNRKGRVGPIWVNADRVHIMGIPSLFLSFSGSSASSILSREVIDACQLDETAVMKHLRCKVHCKCKAPEGSDRCLGVEPDETYLETIRTNLQRLKTHEGSYRTASGTVELGQPDSKGRPFSLEFLWPRKAPAGSYNVEVYLCCQGSVIGRMSAPLSVVEVGFPAQMASLAKENGLLYGVLAVVAAGLAGFGMDFLVAGLRKRKDKRKRRIAEIQGHPTSQPKPAGSPAQLSRGANPEKAEDARLPTHH